MFPGVRNLFIFVPAGFFADFEALPVVPVAVYAQMASSTDGNQVTEIVLFVEQMFVGAVVDRKLGLVLCPSAAAAAPAVALKDLLRYRFPLLGPDIFLVLLVQFLFLLCFLHR